MLLCCDEKFGRSVPGKHFRFHPSKPGKGARQSFGTHFERTPYSSNHHRLGACSSEVTRHSYRSCIVEYRMKLPGHSVESSNTTSIRREKRTRELRERREMCKKARRNFGTFQTGVDKRAFRIRGTVRLSGFRSACLKKRD